MSSVAVALTPATGDGVNTVFTAAAIVPNELLLVDRLPQVPVTDYTAAVVGGVSVYTFVVAPPNLAVLTLLGNVIGRTGQGGSDFPTVASVVSDAAVEMGLVQADIVDPFASADPNIFQLLRLLKSGGREIVKHREWTHLIKEYVFNLAAGVASYARPNDFRSIIADSGWDRTTRFPLSGPTSSEDWQFLQAVPIASNIAYKFREWQGQIFVTPTPGAGTTDTMAYEYNSNSWIQPAGQAQPTLDAPAAATDIVCFNPRLALARLKRDWRRNKKQDSQAEEDDYQAALFDAENDDSAGRTIYLGGRINRMPRKLDRWNLPDVIR